MSSKIRTFIRLSDRIININMIKTISIHPTQYTIQMISNGGSNGFMICGSGIINSGNNIINILKEKSPEDYKYLTDWISKETDDTK